MPHRKWDLRIKDILTSICLCLSLRIFCTSMVSEALVWTQTLDPSTP